MNPHDPFERKPPSKQIKPSISAAVPVDTAPTTDQDVDLNFSCSDVKFPTSCHSSRGSVRETSSGILEVLEELENDQSSNLNKNETQSQQDLSGRIKKGPRESVLKSLLKRTNSAPKKLNFIKGKSNKEQGKDKEKSVKQKTASNEAKPPLPSATAIVVIKSANPDDEFAPYQQVNCCHPIVEKLKTMADKQLSKNKAAEKTKETKKTTIKKVAVPKEEKIILAEQTKIIRLRESPKAEHKTVAAFVEKRDSDDLVEIIELDESPTETRKRREEDRKKEAKLSETEDTDVEPTVDEILAEEFKRDPPKKSPRKTKEHIYEDVQTNDDVLPVDLQSMILTKTITENLLIEESKDRDAEKPKNESPKLKPVLIKTSEVEISIDEVDASAEPVKEEDANANENDENNLGFRPKLEAAEKKVTFSQSTEEYQAKIESERTPEKEDVELPQELIKPKTDSRWSNIK